MNARQWQNGKNFRINTFLPIEGENKLYDTEGVIFINATKINTIATKIFLKNCFNCFLFIFSSLLFLKI